MKCVFLCCEYLVLGGTGSSNLSSTEELIGFSCFPPGSADDGQSTGRGRAMAHHGKKRRQLFHINAGANNPAVTVYGYSKVSREPGLWPG